MRIRFAISGVALLALTLPACTMSSSEANRKEAQSNSPRHATEEERGKYLTTIGGCNDCHTPWAPGPDGQPAPVKERLLSGHPADMELPPLPEPRGPWIWAGAASMTAFSGPWGISYATNLTPHDTGMGTWTEEEFIGAMRTGKHRGEGRPILPPMPWFSLAEATDEDLKAIWAYLQSIPPIDNRVPAPEPPAD